jgi:glutathione peroxidase
MKLFAFVLSLCLAQAALAGSASSILNIPLKDINDKATSLNAYQGKVILLVNVASQCGFTPQYKGLESIYEKFKDKGFVIVGVPCNDFGQQEPGTPEEIKSFCENNYHVTFPLMSKVHVKGGEQHPLYAAITGSDSPFPGPITWNFNKFLIGRDGKIVKRFDSKVKPESAELTQFIETALAAK